MAYLSPMTMYVTASAVLLAACGGGDRGDESTESVPCGDPSRWSTELIPAENAGNAQIAFAADGALHLAYRWYIRDEPGEDGEPGETRVVWLYRSGREWMSERITPDNHDNVIGYSFTATGGRLHLVWRNDYNNSSVHYRRLEGDAWSAAVDFTGEIETAPVDWALLIGRDDRLALVYATSRSDTLQVRMAWIEDGVLAGAPLTLFESDVDCGGISAVFDESGVLHLLIACPISEQDGAIYHLAADGEVMPAETVATYVGSAGALSLAAAPGGTLHALWASEADDTDALLHARRVNGEWTAPDEVVKPGRFGNGNLEVTAAGEVVAVYFDQTTQRLKFLVWSEEAGFAPDCDRLPDLEVGNRHSANFAVHPESGALLSVHGADVDHHIALWSLDVE
jgi:hypothetical protein